MNFDFGELGSYRGITIIESNRNMSITYHTSKSKAGRQIASAAAVHANEEAKKGNFLPAALAIQATIDRADHNAAVDAKKAAKLVRKKANK